MVHALGGGVDRGTVGDQGGDGLADVGEMAGPIGGDVEEGSLAVGPGVGESGVRGEELGKCGYVAGSDGFDDGRRCGLFHFFRVAIGR